ncbi:MAG: hypothetical protein HY900_16550 [Deltaproteobacteria bacterium]|nr:hypothetical protein [Deltaproteobacteria bacterium]
MIEEQGDARKECENTSLGRLPLSIEEGARVFRRLGLGSATLREFVEAVRREGGSARVGEILATSPDRVVALVRRARHLVDEPPRRRHTKNGSRGAP